MPSFTVPLARRIVDLDPAGPIRTLLRAAVGVKVRTPAGVYVGVRTCLVDTGASYTMVGTPHAEWLGLDIPAAKSRVPLRTAGGSEPAVVRDGELRLRFDALPGHSFRLYCVFVDGLPTNTPLLLGLYDFLDVFRVTFDGRFAPDAPAGHMHFDTD